MNEQTNICGMTVIEGIAVKQNDRYKIVVRRPDSHIQVLSKAVPPVSEAYRTFFNVPILRGAAGLLQQLYEYIHILLLTTADHAEESDAMVTDGNDNGDHGIDKVLEKRFGQKAKVVFTSVAAFISLMAAAILFAILPLTLVNAIRTVLFSNVLVALVEGLVRIAFICLFAIILRQFGGIKRMCQYHGAEHKVRHCLEAGKELSKENVMSQSRIYHGCEAALYVNLIGIVILLFVFVRLDQVSIRIFVRIVLLLVTIGLFEEWKNRYWLSDHPLAVGVVKWNRFLQKILTAEPDEGMIEVAIKSRLEEVSAAVEEADTGEDSAEIHMLTSPSSHVEEKGDVENTLSAQAQSIIHEAVFQAKNDVSEEALPEEKNAMMAEEVTEEKDTVQEAAFAEEERQVQETVVEQEAGQVQETVLEQEAGQVQETVLEQEAGQVQEPEFSESQPILVASEETEEGNQMTMMVMHDRTQDTPEVRPKQPEAKRKSIIQSQPEKIRLKQEAIRKLSQEISEKEMVIERLKAELKVNESKDDEKHDN